MGTAQAHVDYIESRMPMVETPRGSNRVPICEEFGPVGGMNYYAWCCATQVVAAEALGTPFLHTASVGHAIAHARKGGDGALWIHRDSKIQVGDWVTYDYGPYHGRPPGDWNYFHIAAVRNPSVQSRFQTIGGNESDSIRISWQDRTYVQGFIRPFYTPASAEENDMPLIDSAVNGEDRIELISLDPAGAVVTKWQQKRGNPASFTKAWVTLGAQPVPFLSASISTQQGGNCVVTGLSVYGETYQCWQTANKGGGYGWSAWVKVG